VFMAAKTEKFAAGDCVPNPNGCITPGTGEASAIRRKRHMRHPIFMTPQDGLLWAPQGQGGRIERAQPKKPRFTAFLNSPPLLQNRRKLAAFEQPRRDGVAGSRLAGIVVLGFRAVVPPASIPQTLKQRRRMPVDEMYVAAHGFVQER